MRWRWCASGVQASNRSTRWPSSGLTSAPHGGAIRCRQFGVYVTLADEAKERLERGVAGAARRRDVEHVIDHDGQLGRDLAQLAVEIRQHAPIAPHLHDPAELAHYRPERLEHVEADPAHVARPTG